MARSVSPSRAATARFAGSRVAARSASARRALATSQITTAISTAVGMARADTLLGQGDRRTVALVGDASIVNGVAMEGLNNAGTLRRQFLVVLDPLRSHAGGARAV